MAARTGFGANPEVIIQTWLKSSESQGRVSDDEVKDDVLLPPVSPFLHTLSCSWIASCSGGCILPHCLEHGVSGMLTAHSTFFQASHAEEPPLRPPSNSSGDGVVQDAS